MDELLKMLEAAQAKLDATAAKYNDLKAKLDDAEAKNDTMAAKFEKEAAEQKEKHDETLNLIADLETKIKNTPIVPLGGVKKGELDNAVKKAIGSFLRKQDVIKEKSVEQFKDFLITNVKAALNLTTTGEGLESVDEVLSREIIERARETYPIVGEIATVNMPRDMRQEVLISFPSVQKGLENVAGANISETDVQRYAEVKNHIAKINAKPRITDEAMLGSDLDLYGHLLDLLDEEFGRYLALQILFGDGSAKAMRGILSSNRLDITNTTGEAWKPTLGAGSRDPDHFPAIPTGVAGNVPATDAALVDWLIDFTTSIPTVYLQNAKWHFNRNFLNRIMKVRDADERPIFAAGYMGETVSVLGYPVVLNDDMPDYNVADAPFLIFGDLKKAFKMSPGAINKMLPDPYTVDGCTVIKVDKEYYEMVGKNDSIIVGVATTNGPA